MIKAVKVITIVMIVLFVALIYKKIVKPLIDRSRLIKQGVVFLNNPIVGEIMAIAKNKNKNPFMPIFSAINVEILKQEGRIPQVTGECFPGRTLMKINTVEMLDDIYVK